VGSWLCIGDVLLSPIRVFPGVSVRRRLLCWWGATGLILTLPHADFTRPQLWPVGLVIWLVWETTVWSRALWQVSLTVCHPTFRFAHHNKGFESISAGWRQVPQHRQLADRLWSLKKHNVEHWEKTASNITNKRSSAPGLPPPACP